MTTPKSLASLRAYLACDFRTYLAFTLDYQGMTAAKCQLEFADHLQSGEPAVGILSCRGSSKTTIASIHYVNWRHLNERNLKVLILSGVHDRAQEIARKNFDNYVNLPWLKHLAPRKGTSETAFNLMGAEKETARSITSLSVLGQFTGLRSDLCIIDDAQMAKSVSDIKYELILSSINEVFSVLRDPDTRPWYDHPLSPKSIHRTQRVVVGTHQDALNSIYQVPEEDDSPHFMRNVSMRTWPAIVPDAGGVEFDGMKGKYRSNFPEILTTPYLLQKQKELPKARWALEYLLDPSAVPSDEYAILRMEKIKEHSFQTEAIKDIPNWYFVADASDGGDYFTCAEVTYWEGSLWVRDILYWRKKTTDECVINMLIEADRRGIKAIHYEAQEKSLRYLIDKHKSDMGFRGISIKEFNHRGMEKKDRLISNLEVSLNSGQMRLAQKLLFLRELRYEIENLRQGSLPKDHDDFLDSLSHCYSCFHDKLRKPGKGRITNTFVA